MKGKNVGLVINQTAIVGNKSLLDNLLSLGVHVSVIFNFVDGPILDLKLKSGMGKRRK